MARLACADVPFLPLQLLLQRHRDWRGHPAAVVDKDSAQGRILWVNDEAARRHVLPGLRYCEGLSIASDLRAGVITDLEIQHAVDKLARRLTHFSPVVEPTPEFPGVFWLNPEGLRALFPSYASWAKDLIRALRSDGFRGHAAIGFTRFGSYAAAKIRPGVTVFESRAQEQSFTRTVPLAKLGLKPALRASLEKLGVTTVGGLRRLPQKGLLARFGSEAHRLAQWIADRNQAPLAPISLEEPPRDVLQPDFAITNTTTLLFFIKRRLPRLLAQLAKLGHALEELEIRLKIEAAAERVESIRPATPTLDLPLLLHLIALRLEHVALGGGVEEVVLELRRSAAASAEQLLLFLHNPRQHPRRDLRAAHTALARIRARFGGTSVVRVVPQERHLPEASFHLEALDRIDYPIVGIPSKQLVRRILRRPIAFAQPQGAAIDESGPYIVSGGWWRREVHREYYFVKAPHGNLLWVYYDKVRRRWFLQGEVQ